MQPQYSKQFREGVLRIVEESLTKQKCEFATIKTVALTFGISTEAVQPSLQVSKLVGSSLRVAKNHPFLALLGAPNLMVDNFSEGTSA
jgi:hypothetical protein